MTIDPYYRDSSVELYHGDSREILPELIAQGRARGDNFIADAVLTDPPYAVGIDYDGYEDTETELDRVIAELWPALLETAPVVALTPGIINLGRYPAPKWVVCWYFANAGATTGRWGFNMWQPVLVYGTDPFLRRGLGRRPDVVVTNAPNTGNPFDHPCPKPLQAWAKILLRVSPLEGEVILDPFAGAGTTLVAAKYSGRRAVGIEQSEAYCSIIVERLRAEVLPLVLDAPVVEALELKLDS